MAVCMCVRPRRTLYGSISVADRGQTSVAQSGVLFHPGFHCEMLMCHNLHYLFPVDVINTHTHSQGHAM